MANRTPVRHGGTKGSWGAPLFVAGVIAWCVWEFASNDYAEYCRRNPWLLPIPGGLAVLGLLGEYIDRRRLNPHSRKRVDLLCLLLGSVTNLVMALLFGWFVFVLLTTVGPKLILQRFSLSDTIFMALVFLLSPLVFLFLSGFLFRRCVRDRDAMKKTECNVDGKCP
ncbi:hypothetical protein JW916_13495 [Candidatus Sumerlaeota bacterium]|nr:hypothetical protein [Candidatus Sumerlaeota bacterium]